MTRKWSFSEAEIAVLVARDGDTAIGTLWWVRDSLWREVLPEIGWPEAEEHPGLSLLRKQAIRRLDAVPMLFGTTKQPTEDRRRLQIDYFYARGLTRGLRVKTYFGKLPMRSLPAHEFGPPGFAPVQMSARWEINLGLEYEQPRVWANGVKDRLSDIEQGYLEAWMKRQGLW